MTRKERNMAAEEKFHIYSGILFHNREFASENTDKVVYDFSCPEYEELREKYDLPSIAGKGSAFRRARRLMHWMAPRLTHCSWYDNHVECNALKLLEYSLDNPEQGINCLNKAKILEECCLAVGIYARRVSIMPYSPYDWDNHVVTEIYDPDMGKWIMLDPTTDGYFVDGEGQPLSLLELRRKFAAEEFATMVRAADRLRDLGRLKEKYAEMNTYICKNLFYFSVDRTCRFGPSDGVLLVAPLHYSVKECRMANLKYRIAHMGHEPKWRELFEERLRNEEARPEQEKSDPSVMERAPD